MTPAATKRLRLIVTGLGALLLLAVAGGAWAYWQVRASLPQLDGSVRVAGLGAAVTVERDDLGTPTIRGESRADVARTLGWLHAQDRFFQMDLLRRAAAGELAELFGKRALPRDRAVRIHGFRKLAQVWAARLTPADRALVEAYAAGVNAGLAALGRTPFEYLLLRTAPVPWRPEDGVLVNYAMFLDLQDERAGYERSLMVLRDVYGFDSLAFFAPLVGPTDAALDGSTAPLGLMPGPKVINLRAEKTGALLRASAGSFAAPTAPPAAEAGLLDPFPFAPRDPEFVLGSNVFVLAGAHTATGAGLIANDMHLGHAVPNIWYRASLVYGDRRITGVTLPGTPAVVVGSNGHVAWGFTNANIDTSDLVIVETNSIAKTLYKAPGHDDFLTIERRRETINVKGEAPVDVDYEWTIWGPIVGTNDRQRPLALRWKAHDVDSVNIRLMDMEGARTIEDAFAIAHQSGLSPQNLMVVDQAGNAGWTIAGQVPRRVGYDGRLPVTWSYGDRKWEGTLSPAEIPVLRSKDTVLPGRIWSGNQRSVGGEALAKLGDSGYGIAPRAAQIRDGLAPLTRATPRDLLAVQLDDRALFLQPWHAKLMDVLTLAVAGAKPQRAALRRHAEKWEGRASVEAVSYRIVRQFRLEVRNRVFGPIFAPCTEVLPGFNWRRFNLEPALDAILREKPLHLLDPKFTSWDELLVAAVDDTIAAIEKTGQTLPQGTWGQVNRARIAHPFGSAFPLLGRWLALPADALPGDSNMPRAQQAAFGVSERIVVSPGREAEGIFHMPGGQSGHPLSPFFQAGHAAWVRGEPTPFLPGPTTHRLSLQP